MLIRRDGRVICLHDDEKKLVDGILIGAIMYLPPVQIPSSRRPCAGETCLVIVNMGILSKSITAI